MHRILLILLLFVVGPVQRAWAGPLDVAQTAVQIARANAAMTATGPLVSEEVLDDLHRDVSAMRVQLESGELLMVKLELALMGIEVVQDGDWEFMDASPIPISDPELQVVAAAASSLEFEASALLAMISRAESGGFRSDAAPRRGHAVTSEAPVSETAPLLISPDRVVSATPTIGLHPQPMSSASRANADAGRVVIPMTSGSAAALADAGLSMRGGAGTNRSTVESERWLEPVHQPRITSVFGMRTHPVTGRRRMHRGVDYGAPVGTSVRATASGRVLMAGWCGNGPGNCVVIEHINGWRSQYFHLEEVHVSAGATVAQGSEIGEIGSTGLSTGPHLHFQLGRDGQAVDPVPLLGAPVE